MSEIEKKSMIREKIIRMAQSDKEFKNSLIDNPKETLTKYSIQVPDQFEVKVVEESATVLYLVLPVNPDELADEQLDAVAGGGICINNYENHCGCVEVTIVEPSPCTCRSIRVS